MENSRTQKSIRNISTGVVSKLLLMVLAFSTRTIFIRLLGAEYNGVNGLYANILSVLSLSELGLGNVLNYSLYGALRDNNTDKVRALVQYFKKIYLGIAILVLVVGVAITPFLQFIIKGSTLSNSELIIYYLLYLLNSVVSYLVVYKTTVLNADQQNYINTICSFVATCSMYILQIVYLLIKQDFLGYLIIQVVCTLGINITLNAITNKKYPYLLDKSSIDNKYINKKGIIDNVKATFLCKIAGVIINNTDNILISVIVGTIYVGYYSNYYMVVSYIISFINIFITGILSSIGNFNAENDEKKSYVMFNVLTLIFSFIAAIVACCFWNCMQDFIILWIGEKNLLSMSVVIAIIANNYFTQIMNPLWMFRETMGLFKQVRYIMIIAAILNIIFSILFGIIWGVAGILFATVIARMISQYWFEARILIKKNMGQSLFRYYINLLRQIIGCAVAIFTSSIICDFIGHSMLDIIAKAFISGICACVCVYVANYKKKELSILINNYLIKTLKNLKNRRN